MTFPSEPATGRCGRAALMQSEHAGFALPPGTCKVECAAHDKPATFCLEKEGCQVQEGSSLNMVMQVNEFVKRVRAAKIHTLIMGHLRKQMPAMMGKQKAQEKLLRDLPAQFSHVQREHHLPAGSFLSPQSSCMQTLCTV